MRTTLREAYAQLIDHGSTNKDLQIIQRVMNLPAYQQSNRIFVFASAGREINTHELITSAYAQGKTVALPKSDSGGMMDFYEYHGALTLGRFNILEPVGGSILYPSETDLMIVPGLSFTREGHRIGYGGGYYDRYLAKHPCMTVGICRDIFIADKLPVSWNDLPVDCVITETAVYQCKNGASFEAPLD